MKRLLFLLCFTPLMAAATDFTIVTQSSHPAVAFSISELKNFLDKKDDLHFTSNGKSADWIITLKKNASLQESAFAVNCFVRNRKQYIELSGAADKDIPCAVYTLLEKLGYTFEFNGYFLDRKIDKAALKNYSEIIVPAVKYRGIRQHINFPMDISSYSLPDAKEYIRNLARMRFNFIAFHSYPGQWYELKKKDTTAYAGNFFYGDRHDIPDNPLIKQYVHNNKTYCIPEIEPYFDNLPKRSQMTVYWLQEVMKEAKRAGMTVQFSFEPRNKSTDIQPTLEALQQIYRQYPQIDAIEMITEESGGWGARNTAEETKSILSSFFGTEILKDSILTSPIEPVQSDLCYVYGQIGHVLKVIDAANQHHISLPPLKLGIYCTNKYNVPAYHLARKYLPAGKICIMPAHGSEYVARNVPKVLSDKNDRKNTVIYSWLEFDGMMYLQQNGIKGIYELLSEQPGISSGGMNTIAFNHWRTAENNITARYAALATIYGAEDPDAFYRNYAQRLGISDPETFSRALGLLQKAFSSHTSNLGFAWKGYWRNGFMFHSDKELKEMLQQYEAARQVLSNCAAGNKNKYAQTTISFLDNRLRATNIYLQAFIKANELNAPNISNEKYNTICNEVLNIFNECLKVYAEMMPDRGCEGTLINLYLSPVKAIKISRQKKTGVPLDEPIKPTEHFDAPAAPIFKDGN
ncbi:hypothetical protein OCK74_11715 [Chitinophagaceae bacterium LB-8]|uniref:Beta-hexosaminidase bacterial type N-terminal domain-containing protein n=1 Tax=Paraflavisolibacter caeni TaxID=2982496 RepID=A0A9X3BHJ9_9BACT|nr:hypothetical protein [Paraflavisolibacter caeni]MCU7549787.1 hypothetical protein [Paraflavisolibacter caeni]